MAAAPDSKPPGIAYPAAADSSASDGDRQPSCGANHAAAAARPPNPAAMGVAYPNTYPPPPHYACPGHPADPNYNPYPYPSYGDVGYNPSARMLILRRVLFGFIAFFVAVGAVCLMLYVFIRPRVPIISVSSVTVSNLNVTSSSISARFDVGFVANNVNTMLAVRYWDVEAAVLYDGNFMGKTVLPPFRQEMREVTQLNATIVASEVYVGENGAKELQTQLGKANGVVQFQLRIFSFVMLNSAAWQMRPHVMRVFCEDMPIMFANGTATAGYLSGGPKGCWVSF